MKKLILMLSLGWSSMLMAQNPAAVYSKSTIRLTPDISFGKNMNWSQFPADPKKQSGTLRRFEIAPNGSVFMTFRTQHTIQKLSPDGNAVNSFGEKGGEKPSDFIYEPTVQGILDGKYIYTIAVDGRMHFFDLNGKWVKTITLKYGPLNTTPLKGGKIAILGFTVGKVNKQSIRILDFYTGIEKEIYSEPWRVNDATQIVIMPNAKGYTDSDGKYHVATTYKPPVTTMLLPFSNVTSYYKPRIATTKDGNLILSFPATGMISIYSPTGQKIRQFKADITPLVITKEDREEYYQKAVNQVKKQEANVAKSESNKEYWNEYIAQYKAQLYKFREPENYPAHLPYFSEMMVDNDNNILLFQFTKEEGSNRFDVYTFNNQGTKIATSSFESDDYDLQMNPALFKFYKHSIYTYGKKKGTENAYRLVKFNL